MPKVALKEQIIGKLIPQETIDGVIKTIVENFLPEKIILFGSYASDNPTPDSDLDLLVIMDTNLASHKRASPIRLLFKPFPCSMDVIVCTPQEVEYWNGTTNHIVTEAFRTGKVVYEQKEIKL